MFLTFVLTAFAYLREFAEIAVLGFVVAGVGTNLSTLGPVARVMGGRTAVLYGTSVVMLTGALGLGLNLALAVGAAP
jgi:uncharacterized membrane protein YraQ (UPF0718 family)